jgi:glycine cleavage system H protein
LVKVENFDFPDDRWYNKDHSWALPEDEGKKIRVGLNSFGQDMAGKILFIRARREGSTVKQGASFASIETGKWVGPLKSPVSGKVVEVNTSLRRKPSVINDDPYGEGWIVVIEPANWESDKANLFQGEPWVEVVKKEMAEKKK